MKIIFYWTHLLKYLGQEFQHQKIQKINPKYKLCVKSHIKASCLKLNSVSVYIKQQQLMTVFLIDNTQTGPVVQTNRCLEGRCGQLGRKNLERTQKRAATVAAP